MRARRDGRRESEARGDAGQPAPFSFADSSGHNASRAFPGTFDGKAVAGDRARFIAPPINHLMPAN